jgi:predicted nucleic acid-binding Zn ribbon protein
MKIVRPLQHAIPGAITALLRAAPLSDGKVTFAWNTAVGRGVERVTSVKLERGVLMVDTTSAQWSKEIERSSGVILKRLQALLGAGIVTSLRVRT